MVVTRPRLILPNATYLITRRVTQRQFLLTPSPQVNQIMSYSVAVAASATGVQLHQAGVMSDHWHSVLTDPFARLPEFMERSHRLAAKAMNALLGRKENFWSSEKPSVVHLPTEEDVLEMMAYVRLNPTAAGLVADPADWPGLSTRHIGERLTVSRPAFFDERGTLPETAELVFVRPDIFRERSDEELDALLRERVGQRARQIREEMEKQGRRFVGAQAVLRQSVQRRARGVEAKRRFKPRVASSDKSASARVLGALKSFWFAYRRAFQAWRAGVREQVFPAGTYALRIVAGVACERAGPVSWELAC